MNGRRRIAVLYSKLSGHAMACLRAVERRGDAELLVVRWPRDPERAPFDETVYLGIERLHDRSTLHRDDLLALVEEFDPHRLFVPRRMDAGYLAVARRLKASGVPVVAGSDTPWTGSVRQRIGCLVAPHSLHRAIDVLWVAGERQRQYARRLGYPAARCWSGYYACDWDAFARAYAARDPHAERTFLFVGRLMTRKGVDVLLAAYRAYRARARDPWRLVIAGSGPLESRVRREAGVEHRGFLQPPELPALMAAASAFVLPSRWEPWGVALQEAAAAGLPLIATEACGAAVHLLVDGYNGFLVDTGAVEPLALALGRMSETPDDERARMGARSHELSKSFTPERWARTLVHGPMPGDSFEELR